MKISSPRSEKALVHLPLRLTGMGYSLPEVKLGRRSEPKWPSELDWTSKPDIRCRRSWPALNQGALLSLLICFFLSGCETTETHRTRTTFRTVVIDAGHGGHDSGANSHTILPEKIWTLEVGRRLQLNLKRAGFRVVMTRSDDTFIPLDNRVAISNRERDAIFVSLHFNYTSRRSIHGLETYYHTPQSADLARVIHYKILEIPGLDNRGIMLARFRVIRNNFHPAILIEGGYLTNRADAVRIASPSFLDALAQKISEGIVKYRGSAPELTSQ